LDCPNALIRDALKRLKLVLLLFASVVGVACETRTPEVIEVPDGYVGWIVVEYGRTDCPSLPVQNGKVVVRLNERGRICVSDASPNGVAVDTWLYVKPNGTTSEIDQRTTVHGGTYFGQTKRRIIFVGSDEQWRSSESADSLNQRCTDIATC
jgi:hypothetical protein